MKVLAFPQLFTLTDEADTHAQLDAAILTLTQSLSLREKIELIALLSDSSFVLSHSSFATTLTHSLKIRAIRESAKDKGQGTNDEINNKEADRTTRDLPGPLL